MVGVARRWVWLDHDDTYTKCMEYTVHRRFRVQSTFTAIFVILQICVSISGSPSSCVTVSILLSIAN